MKVNKEGCNNEEDRIGDMVSLVVSLQRKQTCMHGKQITDGQLKNHEGIDRKSTRLNSSHSGESRMPSSA